MRFKRSRPDEETETTENVYECRHCGGKLETLESKQSFVSSHPEKERRERVLREIATLTPESLHMVAQFTKQLLA